VLAALAKMAQFPFLGYGGSYSCVVSPAYSGCIGRGIYFLYRIGPILAPVFLHGLVIRYVTLFLASTSAFAQRQPKRMLAYSTIASVGLTEA